MMLILLRDTEVKIRHLASSHLNHSLFFDRILLGLSLGTLGRVESYRVLSISSYTPIYLCLYSPGKEFPTLSDVDFVLEKCSETGELAWKTIYSS